MSSIFHILNLQSDGSLAQAHRFWSIMLDWGARSADNPMDYYFHPDYVDLNQWMEPDSIPYILVLEHPDAMLWYPLLKRPLPSVYGIEKFDAISPYGFSGPLLIGNPAQSSLQAEQAERFENQLMKEFSTDLRRFQNQEKIIAEFVRFHPLLKNHRQIDWLDIVAIKDIAWFDLTLDETALYQNLHPQKRRSIKKATQAGLTLRREKTLFSSFRQLYQGAMNSKEAGAFYHFNDDVFQRLQGLLNQETKAGKPEIWLHSVVQEEPENKIFCQKQPANTDVISSAIFLVAGDTVEYFLGANDARAKDIHASAWLLWETALYAKNAGYKRYILGGGLKADDPLFRFKQQLSPLHQTYHIGRGIFDAEAYQRIKTIYGATWPAQAEALGQDAPLFFYRDIPPAG